MADSLVIEQKMR